MAVSAELCEQKKAVYRVELQRSSKCLCFYLLSPPPVCAPLGQCNSISLGLGPKQAGRPAVLVTYMRDELGSCAPGSFTAVALFYIYGAAAGPAVARCESHDSGAGNRDGPVILAPHRLHVTPPVLPILLLDAHHSPQRQTECPQTHAQLRARARTHTVVLFLLRTHPSICFPGHSLSACALLCPYLILLIRPRLFTEVSILRSELPSITLPEV